MFVDGLAVDPLDGVQDYRAPGFFDFYSIELMDPDGAVVEELGQNWFGIPEVSGDSSYMRKELLPSVRADGLIKEARLLVDAGAWGDAREAIQKAVLLSPQNFTLIKQAALLSAVVGNYAESIQYFQRADELRPNDVAVLSGMAGALMRMERYESAEALIEQILEIDPNNLMALFHRTALRVVKGELSAIEQTWESIPYNKLARAIGWLINDREAFITLMSEGRYRFMADVIVGIGNVDHLEEIQILINQALSLIQREKWTDALQVLEKLKEYRLKSYWGKVYLAQCYAETGRLKESTRLLEQVTEQYSRSYPVLMSLGTVYMDRGMPDKAEQEFRQVEKIMPKAYEAQFYLAGSLVLQDKMDAAWEILVDIARIRPGRLLNVWLNGDDIFLKKIQQDPRYPSLIRLAESGMAARRRQ